MESAIANVYRGPLEEFVTRRDRLAKELRSAGDRAGATAVKALRKPSRIAWALNLGATERPLAFRSLVAAVAETLAAQGTGDDVRAAITQQRAAVRQFAGQTAELAAEAGHSIEPAALTNAVIAVVGTPSSFDQLREGCLAEIPEAGGLDFLAGISPVTPPVKTEPSPARSSSDEREREAAAREALREARSKLETAAARVRQAEQEERATRKQLERARQEAESAAVQLREAATTVAEAERRIKAGGEQ